jgi:hypothetical protein
VLTAAEEATVDIAPQTYYDEAYDTESPATSIVGSSKIVGGSVIIRRTTALTSVSYPRTQIITSSVNVVYNQSLTSMSFPELLSAFNFDVIGNPLLTSVSFPKLESLEAACSISYNALLTTISAPLLTQLYYWYIEVNPLLTSISFPKLRRALIAHLNNCAAMTTYSLPMLHDAPVFIQTCPLLATVSLPQLYSSLQLDATYSGVQLKALPALQSVDLSSLTTTTQLYITGTAASPITSLSFPALVDILYSDVYSAVPGTPSIGKLTLTTMPLVTSLSAPLLARIGALATITGLALTTLSLPSLTTLGGGLTVSTCTSLTTITLAALTTVGGSITCNSGNGNIEFTTGVTQVPGPSTSYSLLVSAVNSGTPVPGTGSISVSTTVQSVPVVTGVGLTSQMLTTAFVLGYTASQAPITSWELFWYTGGVTSSMGDSAVTLSSTGSTASVSFSSSYPQGSNPAFQDFWIQAFNSTGVGGTAFQVQMTTPPGTPVYWESSSLVNIAGGSWTMDIYDSAVGGNLMSSASYFVGNYSNITGLFTNFNTLAIGSTYYVESYIYPNDVLDSGQTYMQESANTQYFTNFTPSPPTYRTPARLSFVYNGATAANSIFLNIVAS